MKAKRFGPACLAVALILSLAGAAPPETRDDKENSPKANAKARLVAAQTVYKGMLARWKKGPGLGEAGSNDFAEKIYRWSVRWRQAQADAGGKQADAAQGHLARMRELERITREQHKRGVVAVIDVTAVEFFRLEAEALLHKSNKK